MIIGLTGLIGSGKTLASETFSKQGFSIIDTDKIAREVLEIEAKDQVIEKFGENILAINKTIDRDKLRKVVFNDNVLLKTLESILHPLIFEKVKQQIAFIKNNNPGQNIVLVVPLLFKNPEYLKLIDRSLLIDTEYKIILQRLLDRGLNQNEADIIISQQLPIEEQKIMADDIISNNDSKQNFINSIIVQSEIYRKCTIRF
jgi:dephospho-CoA kinase